VQPSLVQWLSGEVVDPRQQQAFAVFNAIPFVPSNAPSLTALTADVDAITDPQQLLDLASQVKVLRFAADVGIASGYLTLLKSTLAGKKVVPGVAGFRTPVSHRTIASDTAYIYEGAGGQLVVARTPSGEIVELPLPPGARLKLTSPNSNVPASPAFPQAEIIVSAQFEQIEAGQVVPASRQRLVPAKPFSDKIGPTLIAAGFAKELAAERQEARIINRLAGDIVLRTGVENALRGQFGLPTFLQESDQALSIGGVSLGASLALSGTPGLGLRRAVRIGPPSRIVERPANQPIDPPVNRVAAPARQRAGQ